MNDFDLRAVLDRWDLPSPIRVAARAGGINSRVWTVRAGANVYVAKMAHGSALHPGVEVADFLDAQGFESGAPLRTRDGDLTVAAEPGLEIAVLRRVPGTPLGPSNEDLARRGETLARVHTLLRGFASDQIERRWPWKWMIDFDKLALSVRLRQEIESAVRRAEELVAERGLTTGVLHGDAAGGDFLFDEPRNTVGLVDWGAVTQGPLLYDVGTVCALLRLEGDRRRVFLASYVEAAPPPASELDVLYDFVRLRWVVQARYFSWRIAHRVRTGIASDRQNRRGLMDALRALGVA